MHTILADNVRDALPKAVKYLIQKGQIEKTRIGDAWVSPTPVTIKYYRPKEHVLINRYRDANPFFHLMEAMWMLAGRNDGAFLDHYVKDFSKLYGNKNGIIPDAYGFRWRYRLGYDQLGLIIDMLKKDTTTRQAVLQMWDDDLTVVEGPKPCNLVAAFRIREDKLDMTVFNRSNDLIWGCCGANAVHFAILQEYIASMLSIQQGIYYQVSTNLHFYKEHHDMLTKRIDHIDKRTSFSYLWTAGSYEETNPLITFPNVFDEELQEVMQMIDYITQDKEIYDGNISNKFLRDVVLPMAIAHRMYKKKDFELALAAVSRVAAEDWRRAGTEWIQRRIK